MPKTTKKDKCRDYRKLREWICEDKNPKSELIKCDTKCNDGVCEGCGGLV